MTNLVVAGATEMLAPVAYDGTAGLVHDLGNYIQIAMSALRLMSRHTDVASSEVLSTILAQAEDSLERAGALMRGSVASGEVLPEEDLGMDECLTQIATLLRYATGPDIRIRLHVGLVPKVLVNRLGLQNALLNLALNARDAMPGGGNLSISALLVDGPEIPEVEIVVADTGRGMSPQVLARAFEPQFSTKPMGSGMGLPGVRRFVESSRGRIRIDSRPGAGTAVTIRLPAAP